MDTENLYEPFSIAVELLDEYQSRNHVHTFFELVYILSGNGLQCINNSRFHYGSGHMFLITPEDCHGFEIETPTQFFFLRFNDFYIRKNRLQFESIKHLEFILQNVNREPGCILKNLTDKSLVKPIIDAIIREQINRDMYDREIIKQLVNTLIIIVARNIAKHIPEKVDDKTDGKIIEILNYIQNNIYSPKKIKAEVISSTFGISENYLGKFFKRHTNETLQEYINKYRIKLIEHRLLYSGMRIKEIVDEIGFADESHLNKFFKKYKGISPVMFRKTMKGP